MGTFELRYPRAELKREVDFLIVRDRKPWFLVSVKNGEEQPSDSPRHCQAQIHAPHVFQAVLERPFAAVDCVTRTDLGPVPARAFLSQPL